jgi:pimeloyl-ACP methyl ester carboxylesterase
VLDAIQELWQRLDGEPIRVGQRELTQQAAVEGVVSMLYYTEKEWPVLADALRRAIGHNDGRVLLYLADQLHNRADSGQYGQSNFAFPAVRCLDSPDVSVPKAEARARLNAQKAPLFGSYNGLDLVCPLWPVAPAPKQPRIDAAGAAPILVLGTTGDPATPYEHARTMADQLTSGVLITWDGRGHLAYDQSACVRQQVIPYLVDGQVPEDGTRC